MAMNREDPGNCCQFGLASRSLKNLATKLTELPDPPRRGFLRLFSDFYKVISKVYFNKASPLRQPVMLKGRGNNSLQDPPALRRRLSNTESCCPPAELRCVTLDQQEALPCPEAPRANKPEALWVGSHDRRERERPHGGRECAAHNLRLRR